MAGLGGDGVSNSMPVKAVSDGEAEEGVWEVDSWEDKWQPGAPASCEAGSSSDQTGRYWGSLASFGQKLFHSGASQGQALTSALFGGDGLAAVAAAAASSAKAGILVPLLEASQAEEDASRESEDAEASISGGAQGWTRTLVSGVTSGSSGGAGTRGPNGQAAARAVPLTSIRTVEDRVSSSRSCLPLPRLSQSLRSGLSSPHAFSEPLAGTSGREEDGHPVLIGHEGKGARARPPAWGQGPGWGAQHGWRGKVMEVLPVLAVVALAVLGTVAYLFIVDGVFGEERATFSLSCDVAEGRWARSSSRPLYPAMCPYMRDAWNCQKYGLAQNALEAAWRWHPRHCALPLFEAADFLRRMQGKSVGFVGDESTANAFDSMVCMLAEAEAPQVVSGAKEEFEPQRAATAPLPGVQARPQSDAGSGWRAIEGWKLPWRSGASGTKGGGKQSGQARRGVVHEDFEEGGKLVYWFAAHNVTLALFHSPLLVRSVTDVEVNDTACQLHKAAAAAAGGGEPAAGAADVCYPNKVVLDEPDPFWATEARGFDVLVLNSGAAWREEESESRGLGLFLSGVRQENFSMEGLVKQWAYPEAMRAVAAWLGNRSNFEGRAIFRSYSPSHHRRECAGRTVMKDVEAAELVRLDNITRYDVAVRAAIKSTHAYFMNVSLLSTIRGDGHPWMASPRRPQPDCTSWCLPGVPDAWNEILAAVVLKPSR